MKKRLLIIDDHEDMLDFLSEILGDQYQVFTALNAVQAFRKLESQVIHLIISDVMMPEMNGFELCQELKTNVDYCHIPIVLLTAKNTFKARIEGLETGADAYIGKPFSPELLLVQVDNLLKNRSKIKEHAANAPFGDLHLSLQSRSDEAFMKKLNDYILSHLKNPDLNIDELAEYMNMSRPTFYRRVKSVSNRSPKELIDQTRLKKAAELIAENNLKFFQVARKVGYSSQSVFGKNFQKYFNRSPKEYMALLKAKPQG